MCVVDDAYHRITAQETKRGRRGVSEREEKVGAVAGPSGGLGDVRDLRCPPREGCLRSRTPPLMTVVFRNVRRGQLASPLVTDLPASRSRP